MDEQLRRNGYSAEFKKVAHHFIGNVDEACIMVNEGELYVVGDAKSAKSDICLSDSRFSITIICSGNAANASGFFLFLGTGVNLNNKALSEKN